MSIRLWRMLVGICLMFAFLALISRDRAMAVLEDEAKDARQQCERRLETERQNVEFWRWISILAAVVGGLAAAGSGHQAGRSEGKTGRLWGVVALTSGAVAAASPLLPKSEEFQRRLAAADRHYIFGLNVERQMPAVDPKNQFRGVMAAYAVARYTVCISEAPGDEIPEPPKSESVPFPVPTVAPPPAR